MLEELYEKYDKLQKNMVINPYILFILEEKKNILKYVLYL